MWVLSRLTDYPADDFHVAWAPGPRIAFASGRDGDLEIYVMDADGQNLTRLTDNPAFDAWPSWGPAPAP